MVIVDVTAIAAGRLMSCVASIVVVALLPSEEWSTVTFTDLPSVQCSSALDGSYVESVCVGL